MTALAFQNRTVTRSVLKFKRVIFMACAWRRGSPCAETTHASTCRISRVIHVSSSVSFLRALTFCKDSRHRVHRWLPSVQALIFIAPETECGLELVGVRTCGLYYLYSRSCIFWSPSFLSRVFDALLSSSYSTALFSIMMIIISINIYSWQSVPVFFPSHDNVWIGFHQN